MAQIAYILLCHKDVPSIVAQAARLAEAGDCVAIHFDARGSKEDYAELVTAFADNPRVVFAAKRVKCGWGEWSLVAASLRAVRAAVDAFPRATHFYMVSGDCIPIKSAEYIHAYIEDRDVDFIESFDFFESQWIKTGLKEERLIYRHWFNERGQPKRFYGSMHLQRSLGLKRQVPSGLKIMIGSQWWCLRRQTVEAVLDLIDARPELVRFFRTTWIPDETFFQSLVRHLVPDKEIECRTPTFLMFSDYGMPVTFYDDHYNFLIVQDYLFARKISPEANDLKERLGRLYSETGVDFPVADQGRRLFGFLTGQGRIGERFAPRFWENTSTIGRERSLLIVTCKKWHVAKRLLEQIGTVSNLPTIQYAFDEEDTFLPDLGGIQQTLEKRTRHKRALMRMLFDHYETDQLLVCLDPANLDLFRDFYADRCETKLLEIECQYSDAYLEGHAKRVGLAGDHTPEETLKSLVPTLRTALFRESEAIRDQKFADFFRISEKSSANANAAPLANFLGIEHEKAHDIMKTEYLFVD